jgi:hypothetical protein
LRPSYSLSAPRRCDCYSKRSSPNCIRTPFELIAGNSSYYEAEIAKETGAAIGGTLYGDALSSPGGDADTYIRMLRHDVVSLKAAMLKN